MTEEHDCNNCRKMPAVVQVREKVAGREFEGEVLVDGRAIPYRLAFDEHMADLSRRVAQDPVEVYGKIHVTVLDSQRKPRQVGEYAEKVMLDAALGGALLVSSNPLSRLFAQGLPGIEMKFGCPTCIEKHPEMLALMQDYQQMGGNNQ